VTVKENPDRRSALRRAGNRAPVLIDGLKATQAWVVDRSCGGVRLQVPHAVAPADVLSLLPTDAPDESYRVPVEVLHSQQCGGEWFLGCRFIAAPPWRVLLHFG
jgi:hypothetical protein